MKPQFENKVALVTGAAGTIGKGIAQRVIEEGGKVMVTDLDPAAIDALVAELGEKAIGLAADCTDPAAVTAVVDKTIETYGQIDSLFAVAGVTGKGAPIEEVSPENWDFIFAVNCKGTFLFIKNVVPHMKAAGGGSIVNFSSKSGKTGSAQMTAYSAAKGAIMSLTQGLAFELAKVPVRVNCVCPGIVEATGVWDHVSKAYTETMNMPMEDIVKAFTAKVPLGRLAYIEDVVNVSCFLASDQAAYMTGQSINISGGREMH